MENTLDYHHHPCSLIWIKIPYVPSDSDLQRRLCYHFLQFQNTSGQQYFSYLFWSCLKLIVLSSPVVRTMMNYSKNPYCLLLLYFLGFSITPFDTSLKPLSCIYTIEDYFINISIELDTTKISSARLFGTFQPFTIAEIKLVSLSEVTIPSQVIVIGCIIF